MTSRKLCEDVFERDYAGVHNQPMAEPRIDDVPKMLKSLMENGDLNQERLASLLSVDQPQISRWLKGSKPNGENFGNILAVARERGVIDDVRSEDVAESIDIGMRRTISVKGYVGAGAQVSNFNVAPGDLDTIVASDRDTDQTVAVRILGTSLGKFFDRWYVCYDDVRSPITDDLINELCVVGLSDDRVLIKKVVRHGRTKRFDLLSNAESEAAIENVSIEWAAKVTDLRPG